MYFFIFFGILLRIWKRSAIERRGVILAAFTLVFRLTIGLWGIRNTIVFKHFFIGSTVAGHTLWESNNPVTANLSRPAMHYYKGYDLYEEQQQGAYTGSWVPAKYVPGSEKVLQAELSEMEQYTAWNKLVRRFILENPTAVPRLLFYKALRIFTCEPYAESVSLEKGRSYKVKRWVTFVEQWFILIAGTVGLFSM